MGGKGWIALHRKLQDNFLWKEHREFSKAEAWLDILMEAQHSQRPVEVAFGMTALTCNYGESLKSITTWAQRWNWSRNKVYRFFKLLERCGMIVTQSEQVTTRLTVCNYGRYDAKQNTSGSPGRTAIEREQNADRIQSVTDNNANNANNGKSDKYSPDADEFRLAEMLFEEIVTRKPDFKKPNLQKWAVHVGRMLKLDNRKVARIGEVIRWCQQDGFWQNNILSTEKLRDKFDQLELRMQETQKGNHNGKRKVYRTDTRYESAINNKECIEI